MKRALEKFRGYLAAQLAIAGLCFGCKLLQSEFPTQDVLLCKAKVLTPYVGDIAQTVVAQAEGKTLNFISVLLGLDVSPADVLKVVAEYKKCGATNAVDEESVRQLRMAVSSQQ